MDVMCYSIVEMLRFHFFILALSQEYVVELPHCWIFTVSGSYEEERRGRREARGVGDKLLGSDGQFAEGFRNGDTYYTTKKQPQKP